MHIKICGITNLEDAMAAIEAGADLLGFNFYSSSPRHIFPQECARITAALESYREHVTLVGVFVNADRQQIERILAQCRLDRAQLSGDEPPELALALGWRAFKALRLSGADDMHITLAQYAPAPQPPAYLVDAYRVGQFGGTGQIAIWSLAASLSIRNPILLAGGLTEVNVVTAIRQVRPWGVDVASGVESTPGRKDRKKMEAFIHAARSLESSGT